MKIIECPRDAWQSLPHRIPADIKAAYLRALIDAGFRHIDAVSFVAPAAVPQMADSEEVLALLKPDAGIEIIGIVVNQKGAERAAETGLVTTLGFPYSISPTFLERNQKQTQQQSLETLRAICTFHLNVVTYVSMAFGNPYGDPWGPEDVLTACRTLAALGIHQISLADTVGVATPEQVKSLVASVISEFPAIEIGVHLHARPERAAEMIAAAYQAGCRRLDMALTGLGGCPFAQDTLVGNVATETALAELHRLGAEVPTFAALDNLLTMSATIAKRYATR